MLSPGILVERDPENCLSVRIRSGRALDRKTLVCQTNGDQQSREERKADCDTIVFALNRHLAVLAEMAKEPETEPDRKERKQDG